MTIRVLLVDDQHMMHDVVTTILKLHDGIRLIGQAFNGQDAIKLYEMSEPDLVLMDVKMPGMSGVETTRAIRDADPNAKILVLSSHSDYEYIKDMLDLGAVGYIDKGTLRADLADTIRAAMSGTTVLSTEVTSRLMSHTPESTDDFGLTDRELDVLKLMATGNADRVIATELGISTATVRFHLKNLLRKLGTETRSEMLVRAAKNGLI